jgi:hypothetical protein
VAEVVEFLLYQFSCEALSSNPSTTTKNEALSSNLPVPPPKKKKKSIREGRKEGKGKGKEVGRLRVRGHFGLHRETLSP